MTKISEFILFLLIIVFSLFVILAVMEKKETEKEIVSMQTEILKCLPQEQGEGYIQELNNIKKEISSTTETIIGQINMNTENIQTVADFINKAIELNKEKKK